MTWFYPGRFDGHAFVYPGRERRILREQPEVTVVARNGRTETVGNGLKVAALYK